MVRCDDHECGEHHEQAIVTCDIESGDVGGRLVEGHIQQLLVGERDHADDER